MASRDEIIGASPLDIFKETSKPEITKRISGAYNKPAKLIEETIFRMDGTTVDVELYCHPIKIGETKAIQTYVRDINKSGSGKTTLRISTSQCSRTRGKSFNYRLFRNL